MKSFQEALDQARKLAKARLAINVKDSKLFFADNDGGKESNADMMLKKQHMESLKRLKEGNEYSKQLLTPASQTQTTPMSPSNCQLHHRKPFRRRAVLSHVWRSPRRQKLGMQQLGKNYRWRKVFATIRQDFCWHCGSPEKQNHWHRNCFAN